MACEICGNHDCVYDRLEGLEEAALGPAVYTINGAEVTKEEFVRWERFCGFHNALGHPAKPATAGFSARGVTGTVSYD